MIEEFVQVYGEEYRDLIEDSLSWLDHREKEWGLNEPINRHDYIADLVSQCKPL